MSANRIIDGSSIFTGNDAGKDGLRKEIGTYFKIEEGSVIPATINNTPYLAAFSQAEIDESNLLPTYTQTITLTTASFVQDFNQWAFDFDKKILANAEYIDHYFVMPNNYSNISAVNNHEFFEYESLSKTVPPLSLLSPYDKADIPFPVFLGTQGQVIGFDTEFIDKFSINRQEITKRKNLFFGEDAIKILRENVGNYNSYIRLLTGDLQQLNINNTEVEELFYETKMINKLFSFFKRTSGSGLDFYVDEENTLAQLNAKGFEDFITTYDTINFTEQDDEKFYSDYEESTFFETQFLYMQTLSRIREYIRDYLRKDYEEIIVNNETCKSIPIGYKIQKFLPTGTTPVQTIYVMTEKLRKFYDTLITYDTTYRYEIIAIMMTLGNSYSYSNIEKNEDEASIRMTFVNRPSLQFLEVPVLVQDMIATDIPNPPPDIEFYNENGKKNEIIIVLDQSTIVEHSSPNNYPLIFLQDNNIQNKIFTQQKSNQIEFSTLYTSNVFEIYRMDTKPKSYEDFSLNFLARIGTPGLETNNNTFKDFVAPHKKYYYLVRTLTNFGIYSNPTRMYEAELIQDSNDTFLNYEEFKFEEAKTTNATKTLKKFIQIKPTLSQLALKTDSITDLSNPDNYGIDIVGLEPETIWGKRFKIRLKSKKTGKKIDLNIKFNLKDENNQPS